ncbi:Tim10/DDP family zinc finger protein [Geopyxis carbonaria]|nr:Tim10/DDP family zinc finger protein [Geopyxis carbonaria]
MDSSVDGGRLSASEQREFQNVVERRQMKDFMQMYSNLVQKCFDDCINDFTSKAVSSKEEVCVNRCVDKLLKSSERLGQRFAEQNQAMMQQGGSTMGGR